MMLRTKRYCKRKMASTRKIICHAQLYFPEFHFTISSHNFNFTISVSQFHHSFLQFHFHKFHHSFYTFFFFCRQDEVVCSDAHAISTNEGNVIPQHFVTPPPPDCLVATPTPTTNQGEGSRAQVPPYMALSS